MKCRNKYCPCNVQGDCNGMVINNRPSIEDFNFCKFYIIKEK